ncbi:MAG TPA: LysR family transcriptional regulator [Candidatus Binataceae bacterium]|nr:LysR family transcriptional regulator [Candidatus Binataceae bacterium]
MSAKWEWDDIRFFLAIARESSLSGAARALGVDHVTVGRRLAALEGQLGAKLLNRTPDGFATTPAGEAILKECEVMEVAALSLERLAAGYDARAAGPVRVTATEALACALIVPGIVGLRERHPELQIDLLPGVRALDVSRREADLAVRVSLRRPSDPGLVCRRLGDLGFSLYASPKYLAARGTPRHGHGLAGHDVITYLGWPTAMGPRFMGESLEGARISARSNDHFVQVRAAAAGLGISELACFFVDDHPELTRVWPDQAPMLRPVWLVIHEDLRRAARVRVVASAIVAAFERETKGLRFGRRHRMTR